MIKIISIDGIMAVETIKTNVIISITIIISIIIIPTIITTTTTTTDLLLLLAAALSPLFHTRSPCNNNKLEIWGLRLRVWASGGLGFRMGLRFGVWGLKFGVWGLGKTFQLKT
jgi:energy-coupling factor transporter transmembrane protein EcfT